MGNELELKIEIVRLSEERRKVKYDSIRIEADIEELEAEKEECEYRLSELDDEIANLRASLDYIESTTPEAREQDEADARLARRQRQYLRRRYGSTSPQSIRDFWNMEQPQ